MEPKQRLINSEIGLLYLVATDRGLRGIFFRDPKLPAARSGESQNIILDLAAAQLEEYFAGERHAFDLPLDPKGTDFQMQVWEQLAKIPYGQTRSYKDIATAVQNSKASRAVGTANGRNPLSIVVPCHRVINADGTLGGYGGGIDIKKQLLKLEQQR